MLDFVVYRLKEGNWISGHRFEKGRGYILDWTPKGRQRALLLQELIAHHQLEVGARARRFSVFTRNERGDSWDGDWPTQIEQDFWQMCLEELGIGMEESSLAAVAQVIAVWQHPGR